ncbi:MAG: 2-oxoacid:ferredoxin oxidoreductase subunit beta [Saprospiraceae bacterium]|jgi:2-oxoglutarate ferredoxin oxidoreductase subunit beta|nr:2-oxoacid:ferredoxin oxidoreductase subunit beta [Saprospiraceae bacterium]MBK7221568.1 2-oxoacid:ferredoxin oxidoreductase subunit beta [Saprospiraceae bacterium]MBK7788354.1 2-oxoacid:ferredoxin oxidoreductase subunit beta [Saprospiraceae bacterium]MBK8111015.1 2-oxoacid:ferredoxin oxidoreductase subunit beta [Saprospiraceae bacterium]MBK8851571.1 2-oxoacid:ferredoxin oxidoreductase subunit beta [Saprospiraceae bacterium]
MSYSKPVFHHPNLTKNALGYTKKDYEGSLSTLCAGCGHDSISAAIVEACFELNIEPHRVAKLSGIGCSSKTPAYFLNNSHGFNSVHGRMPSIATGANLANRDLIYLGVSGDGDTASIGMGQFCHVIRRNLNMIYVVMNNGCYGLTKGQDSATADKGSIAKAGNMNPFEGIDLCSLAIELGATFVAQSFSGDKSQLIPILQAAMSHKGFALVNVISPCVTFNNNNGSTKSYDYVREHNESMGRIDFVPIGEEITTQYADDEVKEVKFHDGSEVLFHKLRKDFDPENKIEVINAIQNARSKNEILTGILYLDRHGVELNDLLNTTAVPLNQLTEKELCPGSSMLDEINQGYR